MEPGWRAVELMTPWFVFQFLASPVSMAIHVTHHQKHALFLQVFGLAVRVGCVLFAIAHYRAAVTEVYALTDSCFMPSVCCLCSRTWGARSQLFMVQVQVRKSLVFILPWIVGGIVINLIVGKFG